MKNIEKFYVNVIKYLVGIAVLLFIACMSSALIFMLVGIWGDILKSIAVF